MNEVKIVDLSDQELKAHWYDFLHQREQIQVSMNAIDQEILRRRQEQLVQEEPIKEEKKK